MSGDVLYYRAEVDIPELGIKAGDFVAPVETGDGRTVFQLRPTTIPLTSVAILVGMGYLCEITREDVVRAAQPPQKPECSSTSIDIEAALQALATRPRLVPSEESAFRLISQRDGLEAARRHSERRAQFERTMPRVCKTCGETFTSYQAAVTCQACKSAKRKRCCKCGEVFTTESNKEKRCEPCLEKAATAGEVAAAELLRRKRQT